MKYYIVESKVYDGNELSRSTESEIIGYTTSYKIVEQYELKSDNTVFYDTLPFEKAVEEFGEEYVADVDTYDELTDLGIKTQYVYDVRVKCADISDPYEAVYTKFYFEEFDGATNMGVLKKAEYDKDVVINNVYVSNNKGKVFFNATVFFVSDKQYTIDEAYTNFKEQFEKLDSFIMQNRKVYENFN